MHVKIRTEIDGKTCVVGDCSCSNTTHIRRITSDDTQDIYMFASNMTENWERR